ncbi:hypothetical protein PENSTE_c012G00908 [Penicillium steckii]|uniref:Uncharacterized protein n=1 Tax=Penicillium steckii TaxID=303698 RepID=A0A1V6T6D9_9EURO|nr:hypothetical protein PENSTE_c012G00908 [Penicillium steckii]
MTVEMAPLTSTQSNNREEEDTSSDDQCQKVEVQEIDQSSIWVDTWLFEILTLAFSVACFIAICVCLWVYDKKSRPQMGYRLNLNAIVSTLATGCKSSLALVVGEAICQLKWLWFQDSRQRQLFGIQAFDAASRGPLGSLKIIFYHKGRSLASLGAVVMVLLLAFDPFIQLLLSYPVIAVPHPNMGSAKQTREYPLDASAQDTLTDTIWSNKKFTIPTSCPAGNCSWDEFVSLAVCSRCWDITSLANLSCELPGTRESFNKTCVLNVPPGPPNVWEEVKFLQDIKQVLTIRSIIAPKMES